ncbi:GH32 C-terminal domain-containing protein [Nocardioides mesophilus]|nr:GH32 C-terminal domain-containing protein [Nocardioides mesophilus]
MSLPRRCDLRSIDGEVRLVQAPVRAVQALVGSRSRVVLDDVRLGPGTTRVVTGLDEAVALEVELRPEAARRCGLVLDHGRGGRTEIGYERDPEGRGWVYVDRGDSGAPTFSDRFTARHRAPLPLREGALRLQVFLDRASVEVFAGDGERVLTDLVFPTGPADLAVFAEGGAVLVRLGLARLGRDSG